MKNVKNIESAIRKLSKDDLSELRAWFEEYDAAAWDKQFEQDAASGKLDKLACEALSDYKSGKCKEL